MADEPVRSLSQNDDALAAGLAVELAGRADTDLRRFAAALNARFGDRASEIADRQVQLASGAALTAWRNIAALVNNGPA